MTFFARLNSLFDNVDDALHRPWLWLIAVAVLFAGQAFLIVSHEPWADEWQAALIALDAPDLATLFSWLRYEGHPPLWYVFLRSLGALFGRTDVLWIAALISAVIVQSGIVFAAPFTRFELLLIASSQYVLFEFLTISRSTTLGVALLIIAMLSWHRRWFWLVMALLPMVDFLFGVISGIFLILQWRSRNLWWPGIALWLAGSAFAAWSVIPAPDMISAFDAMKPLTGEPTLIEVAYAWLIKMGSLPIPFQGGIIPQWNTPVVPIAGFAWIAMAALCWILTRGQVWHRLMVFGFFGLTLIMSLAIYPIGLRHIMLGAFLLILLVWRQRADDAEQSPTQMGTLRIWLVLLAACGIASASISATRGFDSAPGAVRKIQELGLGDKHWVMLPEWRAATIAGRSDLAFGRPTEGCTFTFVRWDHSYDALQSNKAFKQMLETEVSKRGRFYFISDMSFEGFPPELIAPIAEIPAGYNGVPYNLYAVGRGAEEKAVSLPPCHSQKREIKTPIP